MALFYAEMDPERFMERMEQEWRAEGQKVSRGAWPANRPLRRGKRH